MIGILVDLGIMGLLIFVEYTLPTFGHLDLRTSLFRFRSSSGSRCTHQTVYVSGAQ